MGSEMCIRDRCDEPALMPNFYMQIAYNEGVDRAVTDYISGMSDEFATRLFEELFVPQKWKVLIHTPIIKEMMCCVHGFASR